MRPHTDRVPKSLLTVGGVPFVDHQLRLLAAQGFERVVLCIGYLGSEVQAFVGDGTRWGLHVQFSNEGDHLRGTGGALRKALDDGLLEERFAVLYGDSYLPIEVGPIWAAALADPRPALMTVYGRPGDLERPNAIFEERTVWLYDKREPSPSMQHVDYGLTIMRSDVITDLVPSGQVVDLADVLHELSVRGRLAGFEVTERFYEIGSPKGLAELDDYLTSAS